MEIDLARLGRFVADQFDLEQLRTLCQELDVSHDQLWGDSRSARAFDLVTIMRDRGQLSALLTALSQARPDVFDPKNFEMGGKGERAWRPASGRLSLWLGAAALVLLVGAVFWLARRPATTPSSSVSSTPLATRSLAVATMAASTSPSPSPSPSPTLLTATPGLVLATPTARLRPSPSPGVINTATPSPTSLETVTPSPPPPATAMPSPSPVRTATPILSPVDPALTYDAETGTLVLTPGDAGLERARLCTPLNAYQGVQAVYLIENVAVTLGLALPAQARVTHTYPDHLAEGERVDIFEVRQHPVEGVKVTGEAADFIGCDLIVAQDVRELLGMPAELGEFSDPPRFDHGWVVIEFLPRP